MKTSIFSIFVCGSLVLGPSLLSAQEAPNEGMRPRMRQDDRPAVAPRPPAPRVRLDLSDTQRAEIQKSREAARREGLIKRTDLRVAQMDLRSLLRADKVDDQAIAKKLAEVQAAQGALLKLRVDSALALKKILTPEQQKLLRENRGRRGHASMGERGNRRHAPRPRGMHGRPGRGGVPMGEAGLDPADPDLDPDFDLDTDVTAFDFEDAFLDLAHGQVPAGSIR